MDCQAGALDVGAGDEGTSGAAGEAATAASRCAGSAGGVAGRCQVRHTAGALTRAPTSPEKANSTTQGWYNLRQSPSLNFLGMGGRKGRAGPGSSSMMVLLAAMTVSPAASVSRQYSLPGRRTARTCPQAPQRPRRPMAPSLNASFRPHFGHLAFIMPPGRSAQQSDRARHSILFGRSGSRTATGMCVFRILGAGVRLPTGFHPICRGQDPGRGADCVIFRGRRVHWAA